MRIVSLSISHHLLTLFFLTLSHYCACSYHQISLALSRLLPTTPATTLAPRLFADDITKEGKN